MKILKHFNDIYHNRLAPEVVRLLQMYREAAADSFIDNDEKDKLRKDIKQVIYYTLFLRFQLELCLIND